MSYVLTKQQRTSLDNAVQLGRRLAERGARNTLTHLAVADERLPSYLTDDGLRALRRDLRDKAKQLAGTQVVTDEAITLLISEVAYEQWHRLLFARFLEVNGLLRDPASGATVTLEDCAELAEHFEEPDAFSLAARFASEILPGVFRLTDPTVRLRLAPDDLGALEIVVQGIASVILTAEDALGWVYQFWQTEQKAVVNRAGGKIGGADISPVTQLFTEDYMVRFLLENSLGAWWAARHPESTLIAQWEYLRRLDDGTPAVGNFEEWPTSAAEVTVMDPCCGSGHFLVAAFGMMWRMRVEEESLSIAEAQDAVLRDNLFGLELDSRCTQIATFNVILEAWKQGGYRNLPSPQVACSGIPVRGMKRDWETLAGEDDELRGTLLRLHAQFSNADTLGSLIDPRTDDRSGLLLGLDGQAKSTDWLKTQKALGAALAREAVSETMLGRVAIDVAQAAGLLGRSYTLVVTNPPYLGQVRYAPELRDFLQTRNPKSSSDLSVAFLERMLGLCRSNGTCATVTPSDWLIQVRTQDFKRSYLQTRLISMLAVLGYSSFTTPLRVHAMLMISRPSPHGPSEFSLIEADQCLDDSSKSAALMACHITQHPRKILEGRRWRGSLGAGNSLPLLEQFVEVREGLKAGDVNRFESYWWEIDLRSGTRERLQDAPSDNGAYLGRQKAVLWENESGRMAELAASVRHLNHVAQNWRRGKPLWGRKGICFGLMGNLPATLYSGDRFSANCAAIVPFDESLVAPLWHYAFSGEWATDVKKWNHGGSVTPHALVKVEFDSERWRKIAQEAGPLPVPHSDDPTQWLFKGTIPNATEPLEVAVARLLGYRWPDQVSDDLDVLADADGIVCLPAVAQELDATTRLRAMLSKAYGDAWSTSLERELVTSAGGETGDLGAWLRDSYFAHHLRVFQQRPFIWHISDGLRDGFSVLVNYHRLDHSTLSKLIFTTLGDWIDRQQHEFSDGTTGADRRLLAAIELKRRLQLILDGEAPHDVYIRWKALYEQPIGWDPDFDDGVRLNIRPFIAGGVLRSRVSVNWENDRGKNIDGTVRINDLHPTLMERRAARDVHAGQNSE